MYYEDKESSERFDTILPAVIEYVGKIQSQTLQTYQPFCLKTQDRNFILLFENPFDIHVCYLSTEIEKSEMKNIALSIQIL